MGEKNNKKIHLSTVFLIISLIINIIMGFFIYKLYNDKQNADTKLTNLTNQIANLELNSKNKYIITTNFRWITMQNDGGSNTSIYYQIDLDNNIISKIVESYHANLGGTPSNQKKVLYIKNIDSNIQSEVKSLLNEILTKEDINETQNYNFFTIKSLDTEKYIYNINTIKSLNSLLKKIDELD